MTRPRRSAFTLLELIAVVVILGIVAAVAAVGFNAVVSRAKLVPTDTVAVEFDRVFQAELSLDANANRDTLARKVESAVGTEVSTNTAALSGYVLFYTDTAQTWLRLPLYVGEGIDGRLSNKFPLQISATGGTVSEVKIDGVWWRVHTFTSNGSFAVSSADAGASIEYLVVAGGGGGGLGGGGGGGGGVVPGSQTVTAGTSLAVTVGTGGRGGGNQNDGQTSTRQGATGTNSKLGSITALGGGGGGAYSTTASLRNGLNGGSGGGAGLSGGAASVAGTAGSSTATSPQLGTKGGNPAATGSGGGGGGGATGAGANAPGPNLAGAGGAGYSSSITGTQRGYGGGGGAGGVTAGGAGRDGGGTGSSSAGNAANTALPGSANTGGGGGGNYGTITDRPGAGKGGSGIVVVRYRF